MTLRIANVVHGRFHAFDLVRALVSHGADCTIFTNYPKPVIRKFGIDPALAETFVLHGVLSRALRAIGPDSERLTHPMFSRWVAREVRSRRFDVIHCFSGVAEELFRSPHCKDALKVLVRGSSHIATQRKLLEEEEKRAGKSIDKPSNWIMQRELREYELADVILVLSSFARDSFLAHGTSPQKLFLLPLGADLSRFRPHREVILAREERIRGTAPLRVLTTGTFSYRKGILELAAVAERAGPGFVFRFVGAITAESRELQRMLGDRIEFVPKQQQFDLPSHYDWADLFLFPTIEDGFAVVLSQAQASGLPIIATPNCAAPDLVVEGKTGWIVPVRSSDRILERLHWCAGHRAELPAVANEAYGRFHSRDWLDVGRDFLNYCSARIGSGGHDGLPQRVTQAGVARG